MTNFATLDQLQQAFIARGIVSNIKEEIFGTIAVPLLGAMLQDAKKRWYFQLPNTRLFIGQGANPMALQGQVVIMSGAKAALITPENPTGKWEIATVR
jgi:hypothetical protein